jgi:hypothetical protein
MVGDGAVGDRVAAAVDELDRAIRAMVFPGLDRGGPLARPVRAGRD